MVALRSAIAPVGGLEARIHIGFFHDRIPPRILAVGNAKELSLARMLVAGAMIDGNGTRRWTGPLT
jgi:hypothetical protein